MNFFKGKDLENLKNEADQEYEGYKRQVAEIVEEMEIHLGKLNAMIATINGERHSLRDEIYALYDFLSNFNGCVEKLTPFDFNVETQKGIGMLSVASGMAYTNAEGNPAEKFGEVAAVAAVPIFPVIAVPMLLFERNKAKKKLERRNIRLNEKRAEWSKDIHDKESYRNFCGQAVKIADIYRACIAFVKDAIKKLILPELQAVRCFFYADAMKENVLYDKETSAVRTNPVQAYKDTPYHKHYLFVQNTFDFYVIIGRFFTKTYLTDILADETVSVEAEGELKKGIEEIYRQIDTAKNNMMLTGGN